MAKNVKAETSNSKLDDILAKLDKEYGVGTVLSLDSKSTGTYDVISTGSLGFDYVTLGVGGFVKGKLYELMGWEGTGKSTICGHAAANCQAKGGKVAYIDGEHAVDNNYFKALGVDTSKMLLAQPSCGEEGFNIAMQLIGSGEIDLLIIDSDSSLIPKKVLDGEVGDSAIGRKALLNSNAYPKLKSAISIHKTCVIVVSQYREKIGVMFGNPTTTQGGHALKFYSDVRIEVSKSIAKEGDQAYANITKVETKKNKMFPPFRKTKFEVVYGIGIDSFKEILEFAIEYDIIKKAGSWFSYNDAKIGQGMSTVVDFLTENADLYEDIKLKVIDRLKGTIVDVLNIEVKEEQIVKQTLLEDED